MLRRWTARTTSGKPTRRYDGVVERLLAPWDVWKAGPNKWRSRCPIHKGDNATAFSINSYGSWICFKGCGSGDIEALVMRLYRLNFRQAQEYLKDVPGVIVELENIKLPPWKDRKKPKVDGEPLREADIAAYRRFCPNRLLERGFSREVLRKYEVGYDSGNLRIVIPVRGVDQVLVGVSYRQDFDTDGPKYLHSRFNKSAHLYGFHLWAEKPAQYRRIFLVEGPADVWRMKQLGHAAVAILGSSISDDQVRLLVKHARCDKVVLAFDRDEAGKQATQGAVRLLVSTRFGRELSVADYSCNDPGELTEQHKIAVQPWSSLLMKY